MTHDESFRTTVQEAIDDLHNVAMELDARGLNGLANEIRIALSVIEEAKRAAEATA